MSVDIMTIAICGILLLTALVTPLCNGLFRKPSAETDSINAADDAESAVAHSPAISVVIAAHDMGAELERNLPLLLSQEYTPGFEVIVVNESSTDRTDDILTRLKSQYSNLYTTFIPESSHYLSRRKLALTVGIKAAKNEWIILTDADCHPESQRWLTAMAAKCTNEHDIVLGYTNYEHETKKFYRFEHLLTSCYLMRQAQKAVAFRYNGNNLAIRKSIFMRNNGFLKNLKYLRGEYDFIVNEYAQKGNTAITTHPDSFMRQEVPSRKTWSNRHLFYMETRKHLSRSISYRLLFCTDTALLHLNYIADITIFLCSISLWNNIVTAVAALLSFIITICLRTFIAARAMRMFGEHISLPAVPLMELRVMWQNAWFMLRHMTSDKYDFIRR